MVQHAGHREIRWAWRTAKGFHPLAQGRAAHPGVRYRDAGEPRSGSTWFSLQRALPVWLSSFHGKVLPLCSRIAVERLHTQKPGAALRLPPAMEYNPYRGWNKPRRYSSSPSISCRRRRKTRDLAW